MVVPPNHPKMIVFSRKPIDVGYHHFRKPPYDIIILQSNMVPTKTTSDSLFLLQDGDAKQHFGPSFLGRPRS